MTFSAASTPLQVDAPEKTFTFWVELQSRGGADTQVIHTLKIFAGLFAILVRISDGLIGSHEIP